MREVYFETDNAIFRFYYDDIVEKLPYYGSEIGIAEVPVLRKPESSLQGILYKSLKSYRESTVLVSGGCPG